MPTKRRRLQRKGCVEARCDAMVGVVLL